MKNSITLEKLHLQLENSRKELEGNGPVVIGLGKDGAEAVRRVNAADHLPNDLSCYAIERSDQGRDRAALDIQATGLLDDNLAAVLVFSPDDAWARDMALILTDEMEIHDVFVKAAVLLSPDAGYNPEFDQLQLKLDGIIYIPEPWDEKLNSDYQPLLQLLRIFFGEPSLVCYDMADVKSLLVDRTYCVASATRYLPRSQGGSPEEVAYKHTQRYRPENTQGVIAMMQDGVDMMIDDFDDIGWGITRVIGKEADRLVATRLDTGLPGGEAHLTTIFLT